MELQIKEITFPEVIEFNFDELKKEITDRVDMYKNLVYTDDQIKQAKTDRAQLNKFVKALSDERIKVKKRCLQPYEAFEAKVQELSRIVQEPIEIIDKQVKSYEEQKKKEKKDVILDYFLNSDHPEWLELEQIDDVRWLNSSVTVNTAFAAIDERIKAINTDITTLSNLAEFGFEACEVYKKTLDINRAITEAQRMSQIAKAKAEMEARRAEEEAKKASEPVVVPEVVPEIKEETKSVPRRWVAFEALLTTEDAYALANFFRSRGIEFKRA